MQDHVLTDEEMKLYVDQINFASGQKIGDYEIIKEIGSGCSCKVYQVQVFNGTNNRMQYAMKVIPLQFDQNKHFSRQLRYEIFLLMQCKQEPHCRYIVQLHSPFVYDQKYLILIFEYCQKGNLLNYISQFENEDIGCKVERGMRIFQQIYDGVSSLHQLGYAHQDIKLENVLVTEDDRVKVADFGFIKKLTEGTKSIAGSEDYLPPEMIQIKRQRENPTMYSLPDNFFQDPICHDTYSLGVTLFKMLFYRNPFDARIYQRPEFMRDIYDRAQNKENKVSKFEKNLKKINNQEIQDLIWQMLHYDPKKRIKWDQIKDHRAMSQFYQQLQPAQAQDELSDMTIVRNLRNRLNIPSQQSLVKIRSLETLQQEANQAQTNIIINSFNNQEEEEKRKASIIQHFALKFINEIIDDFNKKNYYLRVISEMNTNMVSSYLNVRVVKYLILKNLYLENLILLNKIRNLFQAKQLSGDMSKEPMYQNLINEIIQYLQYSQILEGVNSMIKQQIESVQNQCLDLENQISGKLDSTYTKKQALDENFQQKLYFETKSLYRSLKEEKYIMNKNYEKCENQSISSLNRMKWYLLQVLSFQNESIRTHTNETLQNKIIQKELSLKSQLN